MGSSLNGAMSFQSDVAGRAGRPIRRFVRADYAARRMIACSLGKMPTTSVLRFDLAIEPLTRSSARVGVGGVDLRAVIRKRPVSPAYC
jgi:hypothetical protein